MLRKETPQITISQAPKAEHIGKSVTPQRALSARTSVNDVSGLSESTGKRDKGNQAKVPSSISNAVQKTVEKLKGFTSNVAVENILKRVKPAFQTKAKVELNSKASLSKSKTVLSPGQNKRAVGVSNKSDKGLKLNAEKKQADTSRSRLIAKTPLVAKALKIEELLANIVRKAPNKFPLKSLAPEAAKQLKSLRTNLGQVLKNGKALESDLINLLNEIRTLLESSQTRKLRVVKNGRKFTYSNIETGTREIDSLGDVNPDEEGFGLRVEEEAADQKESETEAEAEPQTEMMLVSNSDGPKSELDVYQAQLNGDHTKRKRRMAEDQFARAV